MPLPPMPQPPMFHGTVDQVADPTATLPSAQIVDVQFDDTVLLIDAQGVSTMLFSQANGLPAWVVTSHHPTLVATP